MECSTLKKCPDGSCVLTIYVDDTHMTYSITKNRIIFTMYKVAIEYVRENGWHIKDVYCDEIKNPLFGVMTLLGTLRMMSHHKLDDAWRRFHETIDKAETIANDIEDYDIPREDTKLYDVELGPSSRTPSLERINHLLEDPFSNYVDETTYIRNETPPLQQATQVYERVVP